MRLVTVAEMRELERQTFAAGVSEDDLQRRAGAAVAAAVQRIAPVAGTVVALVGSGNNGRDAWIAAHQLLRSGWRARLYLTPKHIVTDTELAGFLADGGELLWHPERDPALPVQAALRGATVALDGLLGIGGHDAPRAPFAGIIQALNAAHATDPHLAVVAVDTPSGLDGDTGATAGEVVRADSSVVLGGAKQGLLAPAAARWTGRLDFADIGVVDTLSHAPIIVDQNWAAGRLMPSAPEAHKGTFGRLLVVAGSERYVGAALLVAAAAGRAGAGIVTLAAPSWLRATVAASAPEVTYLPLPDGGPAEHGERTAGIIIDALGQFTALAIGPGLSMAGSTGDFVERVLRARAPAGEQALPAVIDADALNALAARPDWPEWLGPNVILTPHLGELQRLAPTAAVRGRNPWELARELGVAWRVTLVVKGPVTAIGSRAGTWVHSRPNPALATGGTGDVLTGIIGGLLSRGVPPGLTAPLGVWVHGEAGAAAARGITAGGLLASDLLRHIPTALTLAAASG